MDTDSTNAAKLRTLKLQNRFWLQVEDLYSILPMGRSSHLPAGGFSARPIELFQGRTFPVKCLPANTNGRRSHRVIVECTCGRDIPAGRMHQHYRHHKT